jgi:hypothetical protein
LAFFASLALLLPACESQSEITVRTTKRTSAPQPPFDIQAIEQGYDHLLAAIIPDDDRAWFFKLVAPAAAIDSIRPEWDKWLTSVTFPNDADLPAWQLPENWQSAADDTGDRMRAHTLLVPSPNGPLELTVTRLPKTSDWDDYVTQNVNRWLGQLQQGILSADRVAQLANQQTIGGRDAVVVELRGRMQPTSGSSGRLAGTPAQAAASSASDTSAAPEEAAAASDKPAGKQADQQTSQATIGERQTSRGLSYQLPAGWKSAPAGSMRLASFAVEDASGKAELAVTAFPGAEGSPMADPVTNARRWAGQVSAPVTDEASLQQNITSTQVDGAPAHRLLFEGPEQAILVVMVLRANQVYFFKLIGNRETVARQAEDFDQFIRSVKLP